MLKPATAVLLAEMVDASDLTEDELRAAALDVLHFAWSVRRAGGRIGVRFPDEREFRSVEITVPGLFA